MFTNNRTETGKPLAKGVDIGWLSIMEGSGIVWLNKLGIQDDPLKILKEVYSIDSIRLRVFVDPPVNGIQFQDDGSLHSILGQCDKDSIVKMAIRAADLNMRVMIDFHYSDTWADPGSQIKPGAWSGHSFDDLKTDVYNHTFSVMNALKNAGITPEWVQVGNEIRSGFLFPDGGFTDFSKCTELINQGYEAVKAVNEASKVIIHIDEGNNNELYRYIFDHFQKCSAKFDVIGMSYYPYWQNKNYTETIDNLELNLNDMVVRYGKDVVIAEVGGLEDEPDDTYNLLRAVIDKVRNVPDGRGLGIFYWEPECCKTALIDGQYPLHYALGACKQVAPKVLQFTKAMDAFKG